MRWSTVETEHEGFPLLLRKPDHVNPWQFKNRFTKLMAIEHLLDQVNANGLPQKKYNASLADFDHYMCSLFEPQNDGILFLIETFGGKRTYYHYVLPAFNVDSLIEQINQQYLVNLDSWTQHDAGWNFIDEYPVEIFPK